MTFILVNILTIKKQRSTINEFWFKHWSYFFLIILDFRNVAHSMTASYAFIFERTSHRINNDQNSINQWSRHILSTGFFKYTYNTVKRFAVSCFLDKNQCKSFLKSKTIYFGTGQNCKPIWGQTKSIPRQGQARVFRMPCLWTLNSFGVLFHINQQLLWRYYFMGVYSGISISLVLLLYVHYSNSTTCTFSRSYICFLMV